MMRWTTVVVGLLLVGGAVAAVAIPELQRPVNDEMRQYRLQGVTDQQLRELHKKAIEEAKMRRERAAREKVDGRQTVEARLDECNARLKADPAFLARQKVCNSLPLLLHGGHLQYREQSDNEVFEELIMGICRFAGSVHEARALRCLQPKPWTSREGWTTRDNP
jgi:hypothetical protein